jgi:hypothetical protein
MQEQDATAEQNLSVASPLLDLVVPNCLVWVEQLASFL